MASSSTVVRSVFHKPLLPLAAALRRLCDSECCITQRRWRIGKRQQLSFHGPRRRHWSSIICAQQLGSGSAARVESLSPKQAGQVALFIDLLLDWNQRMNLTAVTERSAMMNRHIADSLSLIPMIEEAYTTHNYESTRSGALKVIDVGSGAGLPGLVLAISCPAWQVTLLESLQKRCDFLEHVIKTVGLPNVQIVHSRAEDAGQDAKFREVYDVAVARAVAEMRVLAELCLPLVRVGGIFVAAKGPNPQEEVEAAKAAVELLGASMVSLCAVDSEGPLGQRTAVVCLKDHATPAKYPRRAGMPNKRPL
ncbi:unnamed protein product [Sphagnum jensenii]|uniref:Ribosomal RNA small subunit methyltransferase G n=1 Tax=Sphagnum jensenii TaxID=128206 RepID=A0ABP1AH39_9BRYO